MTESQKVFELVDRYGEAVASAPEHLHLTSAGDRAIFRQRHCEDALVELPIVDQLVDKSLIDIGTGNGIPGVVFGLARPDWSVCLVDSNEKKASFIDSFCKVNGVQNIRVICNRAEDLAKTDLRGQFSVVSARALAKLPVALELTGAFARLGGYVIVSHGTSYEAELGTAANAMKVMGLELDRTEKTSTGSVCLIFKKVVPTPPNYPRRNGVPAKRPL